MRDNNEMKHKLYYKQYCEILTKATMEAKKLYYKVAVSKSKNKIKTTWNIIHKETSKLNNVGNINSITFANHLQNFIQHPALKVISICEGNYRGLSMWLSTQQIDY